jgi:D-lyxose ketol-isomerase
MTARLAAFASSALALVALAGCAPKVQSAAAIHFPNSYFYDAQGTFLPDRAKDAYIALMRHHGYPVFEGAREKLWVSDYGTGQFAQLGLGAQSFANSEKDLYMLMDLYLLPGQMLPEHWHDAPDKLPQKIEGWLVRHGLSHVVGEGEPNLGPGVVVPQCHQGGKVSVQHETVARPGQFVALNRVGAHHWMLAGPEGAILSEVANVHVGKVTRHADPAIDAHFLKP